VSRGNRLRVLILSSLLLASPGWAADHNDPNAINSIFADVPLNAADLYDFFGFPSDDKAGGEKVVLALTFAPAPKTGVLDPDMLYRLMVDADPRASKPLPGEGSLDGLLQYAKAIDDRYLKLKAAEVRVKVDAQQRAHVDFIGFSGGSFSKVVETNKTLTLDAPGGHRIQLFVGGRDDAFFNDLPGFFRSINYAPQFYHVPQAATANRELPIPKTLLELEGNRLFNFDPAHPQLGQGEKTDLPPGPYTWSGKAFHKDAGGNYRFVYSGKDAQAGRNINAIVLEIPLAFLTRSPEKERIVNAWGESWVLKASSQIETIPDSSGSSTWFKRLFAASTPFEQELGRYKRVDTDGVPFEDAALSERENDRQLGANNLKLARHFVVRFGHLGWGFGPSVSALGLGTCFDHDDAPVSVYRTYKLATEAFPRVKKCFFQDVPMPDDSWNPKRLNIPLKRPFEIFIPNLCSIDMDTTGTWPFGRRLEDQVATRFLSLFLDMETGCGGKPCNLESLSDQALWDSAPIQPKTPPNPLKNDKEFLARFPYLAEPW
jgi:Domain of unknown function (DUF4331)